MWGAVQAQIVKTLDIGQISAYRALDKIRISTGALPRGSGPAQAAAMQK
jgi:hypothetical protein